MIVLIVNILSDDPPSTHDVSCIQIWRQIWRQIYINSRKLRVHLYIIRSRLNADLADTTAIVLLSVGSQSGGELALLTDLRSLPVEDIDRSHNKTGETSQDGACILNLPLVTNIGVHGCRVHSRNTGQKITSESVTTGRRGGVNTIGSDHVINGGKVDRVIGDTNTSGENHGSNPMDIARVAERCPSKAKQTDRFKGRKEQQPLKTTLRGNSCITVFETKLLVSEEPWEVGEVGDEIGGVDGNNGPSLRKGTEAPSLLVHEGETLQEGEDQSIGETGQKRQAQHDGLTQKHVEGSCPNLASFLERDTRGLQFIGSVDVGVFSCLAAALGFIVHDDGRTTLGHEEDDKLGDTSEDKLNPKEPFPFKD